MQRLNVHPTDNEHNDNSVYLSQHKEYRKGCVRTAAFSIKVKWPEEALQKERKTGKYSCCIHFPHLLPDEVLIFSSHSCYYANLQLFTSVPLWDMLAVQWSHIPYIYIIQQYPIISIWPAKRFKQKLYHWKIPQSSLCGQMDDNKAHEPWFAAENVFLGFSEQSWSILVRKVPQSSLLQHARL